MSSQKMWKQDFSITEAVHTYANQSFVKGMFEMESQMLKLSYS